MKRIRAIAQDIAQSIIDSGATDVDEVETWPDHDLYDWLESLGYEWDGSEWVFVGFMQAFDPD